MTVPPAIAPYVPYYAEVQPYVSVAEFLAAPTGIDTSQLMPGQGPDQNRAALVTQIAAASSYADSLCYQVLAATQDLQVGEYRVHRDGTIKVAFDYSPVIAVTGVSLAYQAGQFTALSDLSGLWPISRKVWRIPVSGLVSPGSQFSSQLFGGPAGAASAGRGSVFAQVQYVNGYANTALAQPAVAGASSIVVTSPLGLFPGVPLTVYDDVDATTESVVVGPGYVQGSTTVPLVAPLVGAHASGIAVSALPRAIKQAVIALTAHLIKSRGAESIAFSGVSGGPAAEEKGEPGASEEYDQAVDLLHPFRRVA